ncbi:MAG TPA: M55 family metallopeptidase [Candidatus Baltobacteraceae bacterium]|nr:M55 family metallopeptidase [Candidatus Baltobacteraceae bacterium]
MTNIYISSDMEGIAGVCAWEQVDARTPHPEYATYRRYYTQEVRSAIEGARAAGASAVLVNDSHGPMRNLELDELPDDVRVVFGNRKPFSMVQDADASFAGAFFIGYHGAIGQADAVLCHTYTPSVIYDVRLNDVPCSEATLNAALLGHYGVPVLLVTGDRTTVDGVREQMPWVHGVVVKESIGNFAASSMTPAAAQRAIAQAAQLAVAQAASAKPYRVESPVRLDVTLAKVEQADLVEMIPGFARTGPRSVRFVHADVTVAFKAFVATWRLGATA